MSEDDLEVVLRAIIAFNTRDLEGLLADLDPDVVWEEGGLVFPDLPDSYRGRDGVVRWYREAVVEGWETLLVEPLDLRDEGGGHVVQLLRVRGRGRGSGAEVDMLVRQTVTVSNGRIVHRRIERA